MNLRDGVQMAANGLEKQNKQREKWENRGLWFSEDKWLLMKWNTKEGEENMQSTGNETIYETSPQNLQQPSTLENSQI